MQCSDDSCKSGREDSRAALGGSRAALQPLRHSTGAWLRGDCCTKVRSQCSLNRAQIDDLYAAGRRTATCPCIQLFDIFCCDARMIDAPVTNVSNACSGGWRSRSRRRRRTGSSCVPAGGGAGTACPSGTCTAPRGSPCRRSPPWMLLEAGTVTAAAAALTRRSCRRLGSCCATSLRHFQHRLSRMRNN